MFYRTFLFSNFLWPLKNHKIMKLKTQKVFIASLALLSATCQAVGAEGDAWNWPAYSPTINYSFKAQGITYTMPTKNYEGDCYKAAAGVTNKDWWSFVWGSNRNSLVSDVAIQNLLTHYNEEFSYITDSMGWPRDKRVQDGYRSTVYLYGSMDCTGSNDPTATGGWQSYVDGYPCVVASYYPVYSFDPSCPYSDRQSQMSAMIHEGIHAILTTLGAKHVHWFQEGGNTWLQQEMEVRRHGTYSGMGFLNATSVMAPFVPIECYSGWLLDGSFGGPGAQGVDAGGVCNWRRMLGGTQYSNIFPTFLGLWVSEGAVPWIWVNTTDNSKYILETMAGALGDAQTRRLIMEYRSKLAMLDMKGWSEAMRTLLNDNVGATIEAETTPCTHTVAPWTISPYVVTTDSSGWLIPENRTTPGWSGANIVPLKISGNTVKVHLKPLGDNMSLQLCYRATDGTPVYSRPSIGDSTVTLNITKAAQDNMVFAVVCNTDYAYKGDATRTKHHDYRLQLLEGVSGAGNANTKYYNDFNLDYDWNAVSHPDTSSTPSTPVTPVTPKNKITELVYNVTLPIASNYAPVLVALDSVAIKNALGLNSSVASVLGGSVNLYGLNVDGSFNKESTANYPGHWFNAAGNVCAYGTSSTLYSELVVNSMSVNIGNYPDNVQVGSSYTIRQALVRDTNQVNLIFNVQIAKASSSAKTVMAEDENGDMLDLFYGQDKTIYADYSVPFDCNVSMDLYTAYGALVRHLVNAHRQAGSYNQMIDLQAMGLSQGVYLIRLSYPGHQETKVAITAVR